ncbi:PqiC family protein [Uliginosibacterium sp. H3]|uniref:PqiC family protein n=1 Tax=Uliginosibacterium silvisoli TaxID=3114758 RepID=A0ABU6K487_9RHOO|nr:PqiC family protein [Uliginosibacterium sp. H3]
MTTTRDGLRIRQCVRVATLGVCLLLGACASPNVRYYALSSPPQPAGQASPAVSIAVGPATVAEAIDRPQLVVRRSATKLDVLEEDRWVDTPKREIPRVLAANLASLIPAAQVAAYPQQAAASAAWHILLDVQSFEAMPGDAVSIELVYTLRRESDGQRRSWRISQREPMQGTTPEAVVAAWSRALAQLAVQMAEQLKRAGVTN